jgi:phycobilisome rod-core linker protein
MGLPLLETKYVTRPHRVASIPQMGADDTPIAFYRYDIDGEREFQNFIYAAYRQIFSEHLILESNRQVNLESQLRTGAVSVQDFVRGLGKSEVYRRLILEPNSNYRFVEVTLKRFLGREPYSKQETIQWSIIIAEQGYLAFIDAIVDSPEYAEAFGADTLPYQLQPLNKPYNLVTPRHGADWIARRTDQLLPGKFYRGDLTPGDASSFLEMAESYRRSGGSSLLVSLSAGSTLFGSSPEIAPIPSSTRGGDAAAFLAMAQSLDGSSVASIPATPAFSVSPPKPDVYAKYISDNPVVENYSMEEEVQAGDKESFLAMAQEITSGKGSYGQTVSAWDIRLPDMTNNRTPELVGTRRKG